MFMNSVYRTTETGKAYTKNTHLYSRTNKIPQMIAKSKQTRPHHR